MAHAVHLQVPSTGNGIGDVLPVDVREQRVVCAVDDERGDVSFSEPGTQVRNRRCRSQLARRTKGIVGPVGRKRLQFAQFL